MASSASAGVPPNRPALDAFRGISGRLRSQVTDRAFRSMSDSSHFRHIAAMQLHVKLHQQRVGVVEKILYHLGQQVWPAEAMLQRQCRIEDGTRNRRRARFVPRIPGPSPPVGSASASAASVSEGVTAPIRPVACRTPSLRPGRSSRGR